MKVTNYQPVSLVCKQVEKVLRGALMNHTIENNLLSDYEHGFVNDHSCTTQLLNVKLLMQCALTLQKPSTLLHTIVSSASLNFYSIDNKVIEWIIFFREAESHGGWS